MLKKLFRAISGGKIHPKFTFSCTGINSELVVVANLLTLPRALMVDLLTVPGARITHCRWLIWEIAITAHTQRISRIHNNLLRFKKAGA